MSDDVAPTMPSGVQDVFPELGPQLDRASLARAFGQRGRLRIPHILTDASARRILHALQHETPWGLILNEGKTVRKYASVSPDDHQAMALAAWDRAHSGFQYFYHYYRLVEDRKIHPPPGHYLLKLIEFLTGTTFLSFIREVTGVRSITRVSSTATLYKPLDFLTMHDDSVERGGRQIAYVLNMTPAWRPDWGGALQFFDSADHIEEAYLPSFNALNLFRVPQHHSVSQVAAFGGLRYSVSGWFESDETAPGRT
jgi:SM-20-related protein